MWTTTVVGALNSALSVRKQCKLNSGLGTLDSGGTLDARTWNMKVISAYIKAFDGCFNMQPAGKRRRIPTTRHLGSWALDTLHFCWGKHNSSIMQAATEQDEHTHGIAWGRVGGYEGGMAGVHRSWLALYSLGNYCFIYYAEMDYPLQCPGMQFLLVLLFCAVNIFFLQPLYRLCWEIFRSTCVVAPDGKYLHGRILWQQGLRLGL